MRPKLYRILLLLLLGSFFGCSTPYMTDRGRDAADILTATIGKGLGAKVRLGPLVAAPLMFSNEMMGLRGGVYFHSDKGGPYLVDYGIEDCGILFLTGEVFGGEPYEAQWHSENDLNDIRLRGKFFQVASYIPLISFPGRTPEYGGEYVVYPAYYLTQIEVALAFGVGVRLGFNPGELLDFALGWTTFDLFGDDLELDRMRPATNGNDSELPPHN